MERIPVALQKTTRPSKRPMSKASAGVSLGEARSPQGVALPFPLWWELLFGEAKSRIFCSRNFETSREFSSGRFGTTEFVGTDKREEI